QDLACLEELPADAINYKVQNQFTALPSFPLPASRDAWDRARADLMSKLKDKVFRWFPSEAIPFETKTAKNTGNWAVRYGYASYRDVSFQTEDGVRIRAQVYYSNARPAPMLIYVRQAADSFSASDVDELLPVFGRNTVLVLNPRFTDQMMGPAEAADVERSAVWI